LKFPSLLFYSWAIRDFVLCEWNSRARAVIYQETIVTATRCYGKESFL